MARRIKPLKLRLDEFQDLVTFWLTDGADEKSIAMFERDLTMPPKGVSIRKNDPVWGRDAELSAFRRVSKPTATRPKAT